MTSLRYSWNTGHTFDLVYVEGTNGCPYSFGEGAARAEIDVPAFFIGTVPVTQALWTHVAGTRSNPAAHRGMALPVENVSWDTITQAGGFLDLINESRVREELLGQLPSGKGVFRLPSETEWEYAARGGPHWGDGFRFSGSNDIDVVAWYDRRHGDHTRPVAEKAPNQLGLYDMSGNVWEWCQDVFISNVADIPRNGTPFSGPGAERVLRGGCFHNWAVHCTVSKRYQIERQYYDGCIGFRLVLSIAGP